MELSEIRAISLAIDPTLDSIWRSHCRNYSVRFHTPLHLVYELEPMMVLQALLEDKYTPYEVQEDLDGILDTLNRIKDPSYRKFTSEETEQLVDAVLNKEIERAKRKKKPTQETIQEDIVKAESKPKSGKMDFSDLEKLEEQTESGKSGF